jgi:filamentous hemagglutinin family protein
MNNLDATHLPAKFGAGVRGQASIPLLLGIVCAIALPAGAQTIAIDGTTPTTLNGGDTSCSGDCTVTGGSQSGGNLFHSFTRFGIDTGATVTFTDPGVQNIITRVTGSEISVINGLLEVNGGSANFFLLNPNGITFGESASLQLGGSFVGSTANGVVFEDGVFSLTDSSAANSLLTINVPIGLQVGTEVGNITMNGTGSNLFVNPNFSLVPDLVTPDLQLNQGTLALVGGSVTLDSAVLSVPGGRVEVGSVENGQVGLIPLGEGFRLSYEGVDTFGNIILDNAALIDVSATSAGNIHLQGQTVSLNNGSALLAGTLGDGQGGGVQVNADSLLISGTSSFVPSFIPPSVAEFVVMPSGVFAGVQSGAEGTGGNIDINVRQLSLDSGAQIAAGTFDAGDAGTLNVISETVTVRGGRPAGPSGLFTTVGAAADGGPVGAATGNGGNLNITANMLSLQEGGQVSAGTFGFGNAGNLTINSNLTEVIGSFGIPGAGGPSSIRAASERPWAGAGGTLAINTDRLVVADGGQIVTGTLSSSDAGDLIVRAESVELRGGDDFGQSGLLSNAVDFRASGNDGSSGNIVVETGELLISDGATVSVSNTPSGANPNLTPGQGPAGNLTITAQNILMTNGGSLTADTLNGDRANIRVTAETLTLQNSRISTNATGTATGGNINLDTGALTLLDSSTISANSVFSFGGRVVINTDVLVQSADSQITATSAVGPEFDGVVEINSPNPVPSEAQTQEENPSETKQIIAACEQLTENELTVTGQGGLPADPTQILTAPGIWADVRLLSADDATTASQVGSPRLEPSHTRVLSEAQGMARNNQGQLVLVSEPVSSSDSVLPSGHQASLCR